MQTSKKGQRTNKNVFCLFLFSVNILRERMNQREQDRQPTLSILPWNKNRERTKTLVKHPFIYFGYKKMF